MSAMHVDGRTLVGFIRSNVFSGELPLTRFARETDNGRWAQSTNWIGVGSDYGTMAHHPRWGYLLAWHNPVEPRYTFPVSGPFLIRGRSVDAFFKKDSK